MRQLFRGNYRVFFLAWLALSTPLLAEGEDHARPTGGEARRPQSGESGKKLRDPELLYLEAFEKDLDSYSGQKLDRNFPKPQDYFSPKNAYGKDLNAIRQSLETQAQLVSNMRRGLSKEARSARRSVLEKAGKALNALNKKTEGYNRWVEKNPADAKALADAQMKRVTQKWKEDAAAFKSWKESGADPKKKPKPQATTADFELALSLEAYNKMKGLSKEDKALLLSADTDSNLTAKNKLLKGYLSQQKQQKPQADRGSVMSQGRYISPEESRRTQLFIDVREGLARKWQIGRERTKGQNEALDEGAKEILANYGLEGDYLDAWHGAEDLRAVPERAELPLIMNQRPPAAAAGD